MWKPLLYLLLGATLWGEDAGRIFWPAPPDPARIEFISSFSSAEDLQIEKGFFSKVWDFLAGNEDRVLLKPFGLHVVGKRIYVGDVAARAVFVFDRAEKEMILIEGSENEPFISPVDITTDGRGRIYVSDSVLGKVCVFDREGDFLQEISDPGRMQRPVGIAVNDLLGRLYVVDAVKSQIHVFNLDGVYLRSIGKWGSAPGTFNRPTYIAIGKNGDLYVSDSMNHRVQILNAEGEFISSFGKLSKSIGGFASPRGIALDSDENIYVTDTLFNATQIFNKEGALLLVVGHYGSRNGEFAVPEDIAITPDNRIFLADSFNMRVQTLKRLDVPETLGGNDATH